MSGSKKEVNYSKQKMKSRIAWIIATIFAVFWLLVALVPFVFMILNSLRKQFDMLSQGVFHLPDPWYFENYPNIVKNGFFGYFFGTAILANIAMGSIVQHLGWDWGFIMLLAACALAFLFISFTYREEQYLVKQRK